MRRFNQSVASSLELTQMLELAEKDVKRLITLPYVQNVK